MVSCFLVSWYLYVIEGGVVWVEGVVIYISWIWCQVDIKVVWWVLVLGDALPCRDVVCKCRVENGDLTM